MKKQLLKEHQKTDIRFQQGDLILYEPNQEQLDQLKELVLNVTEVKEDASFGGVVDLHSVRFIIQELTSIGDEVTQYDDEELVSLLDNGDGALQILISKISDLLHEVGDAIIRSYVEQLKAINKHMKLINGSHDVEEIKEEMGKFLKDNDSPYTFDELVAISTANPKQAEEIILEQMNAIEA